MRTIRIDEEVWAYIKSYASPLEDTANSVLRRLLKLETDSSHLSKREKQATNRLSPTFTKDSLILKFASGDTRKWSLPSKKVGGHISKLFEEINSFIRSYDGTEGQIAGMRYQLHKNGYYVNGPQIK